MKPQITQKTNVVTTIALALINSLYFLLDYSKDNPDVRQKIKIYFSQAHDLLRRLSREVEQTSTAKKLDETGLLLDYLGEYNITFLEALHRSLINGKIQQFVSVLATYAEMSVSSPDELETDSKQVKIELLAKFGQFIGANATDSELEAAAKEFLGY